MIREKTPLSMAQVDVTLDKIKESEKTKEVKAFIKKFSKIDAKNANKLKEEIESMNIVKLKRADIVKIIDVLPENAVELNKIFTEVTLDSDETNKILSAIKNNK